MPNASSAILFLDFRAAFDTVRHNPQFERLGKCVRLSGTLVNWARSDLEILFVIWHSEQTMITCGVPQGFVLGKVVI